MKSKNKIFSTILLIVTSVLFLGMSCKKKTEPVRPNETGTVTDVEGNVYNTVKIGNQWWMSENLKTKTYRNGTPVKKMYATDPDSVWAQSVKGMYCEYYNTTNKYGLLYNWYVITDTGNIAPTGWHVPTDTEWKELEKNLGMSQSDADGVNWRGGHEADKLKIKSPEDWSRFGDVWSTNESGFTAMGGSCRLFNGVWGDPATGQTGFWWSSSFRIANNQSWYRYLDYKKSNVFRYYGPKSYGMSIRCVKD